MGDGGRDRDGTGLVSVEYTFVGETAHSAGAPWRGRSALDAVELMNIGWNYRREHLPLEHRSHYVVTNGGDQPNVVPRNASVWYYFRQTTYANIVKVGMPEWSEADQTFARAVQKELGANQNGLSTRIGNLGGPVDPAQNTGGGSDDIGDISWNVPTVTLSYPSNIPGLPGHHWSNAIAMATPVAHKGVLAGAKVQAMTLVDLFLKPEVIKASWDYFNDVQTRTQKYEPFIRPEDQPAIDLNRDIMAKYREQMRKFYYDPTKYKTYLEQLGIAYPTIKK